MHGRSQDASLPPHRGQGGFLSLDALLSLVVLGSVVAGLSLIVRASLPLTSDLTGLELALSEARPVLQKPPSLSNANEQTKPWNCDYDPLIDRCMR